MTFILLKQLLVNLVRWAFFSSSTNRVRASPTHFDYCSSVWDELSVTLSDKLQKLQNRAARVITRSSYDTSTSFLLKRLHWDDLSTRRKKLKATLMFKTIKGLSPLYFQSLFSIRSTSYNLRDSEIKLDLPKPRTNYRKRSFGYSGALFNNYSTSARWI